MRNYVKAMEKHNRKKSLREAKNKIGRNNESRKPRRKNWAPDTLGDWDEMEFEVHERIMPRGERERRRVVEEIAFAKRAVEPELAEVERRGASVVDGIPGLVVEVSADLCRVAMEEDTILCSLRGSLKAHETGYTNVVAVGDRVIVNRNGGDRGVVEAVLPRRGVLARRYSPDKEKFTDRQHIVVANVDQLLIVASWREPYIWPELIDRYLITAQLNRLEAVICINKIDLVEDQAEFKAALEPYYHLGNPVILTSARTGAGMDQLREALRERTTVLAGMSGVGKSSLLTAVQPALDLPTQDVTRRGIFTGQGRHTTTQATLLKLEGIGNVVDTPGIRQFGLVGMRRSDLVKWYPEMASIAHECRYNDCAHIDEPECAVKLALAEGAVSEMRYKSYCDIYMTLPE